MSLKEGNYRNKTNAMIHKETITIGVEAKKRSNVIGAWKKRRMEIVLWLINNYSKVSKEEWLSLFQSSRRSRELSKNLVKKMALNSSSMTFQKKCLDLLDLLLVLNQEHVGQAHLFSNTLLLAGIMESIGDAMENFPTELELQQVALKVLRTLTKYFVPILSGEFKRGLTAIVRAMDTFPLDAYVQKFGCGTLFRYSQNCPQRMKHVIEANGLEAVAAACDNFPATPKSNNIHRVAKIMLNHMLVSMYAALETTNTMRELEYGFI